MTKSPDVKTILRSILSLLPSVIRFDMLAVLLKDSYDKVVRLHAIEPDQFRSTDSQSNDIDSELALAVLEQQRPIIINDVETDLRFRATLDHAKRAGIRSFCALPLTTSRRQLGVLSFGTTQLEKYREDDVQLMTRVASHLAILLENAINFEDLERERDRLDLLLEINNVIISQLTLKDLVTAVSTAMRRRFHHNYTGIWILENGNKMKCAGLDFPDGRGFIENFEPELDAGRIEELRLLQPHVASRADIERGPEEISEPLLREGIASQVVIPLRSKGQVLGVLSVGSVREGCFQEDDIPLFTQIGGQVALAIENALAFQTLTESRDQLRSEKLYLESEIASEYFEDIIGKSAAIREVMEQVAIVAKTDATVLLAGETGTGKEIIARAIHNLSERHDRTFVRLNCAAFPSGLVESELFGHERGAFTGALTQKIGRFELANKGTLFLDEVGDIPLEVQIKLLRTLQEREFERLGSTRTIKVDVRLIAATNRDLSTLIKNGQFREDLFYRLNVFPIHIPPLRERPEDIPLLVRHFASKFSRRMRKEIGTIPSSTLAAMSKMRWPGNVRELENLIERAVILTRKDVLQIPLAELESEQVNSSVPHPEKASLNDIERSALLEALRKTKGRISGPNGAAALLGLKRTTFHSKMRRLNIHRSDF